MPVEEIQRGIKHGVRKINIDTDNRMAMTGQIRKVLTENPGEFDPRKYLKPAMEAMTKLCKQRLQEFNTAGQASKIKRVLTPAEMAKRYASGELDPKFGARPPGRGVADPALSPQSSIDKRGLARWPRFRYGNAVRPHLVTWTHGRARRPPLPHHPRPRRRRRFAPRLAEACATGDVAAVLLRASRRPTSAASINRVKALAPAVAGARRGR